MSSAMMCAKSVNSHAIQWVDDKGIMIPVISVIARRAERPTKQSIFLLRQNQVDCRVGLKPSSQ
jgi:hypothetical protein